MRVLRFLLSGRQSVLTRPPRPATNVYAPRALQRCGLPLPPLGLVTSNDVTNGKPHPAPYLAGARRLGVEPTNCEPPPADVCCALTPHARAGLVIEDAPSGIIAGRAAGCKVIAVCTSHTRQQLLESGARPDYIVKDLTRYVPSSTSKGFFLIKHATRRRPTEYLRAGSGRH